MVLEDGDLHIFMEEVGGKREDMKVLVLTVATSLRTDLSQSLATAASLSHALFAQL